MIIEIIFLLLLFRVHKSIDAPEGNPAKLYFISYS